MGSVGSGGGDAFVGAVIVDTTSRRAIRIARVVAIVADGLQLVLLPLFVEGFASLLNDALDVVVGIILVRLVGWNPVFLPTIIVELLPFGNLAPTWTIALFIATRSRQTAIEPTAAASDRDDA